MDSKKLEYLLKIAENQSITEAAKQLYLSQPALSQVVSSFEKAYDTKLFERRNGRLFLTYTGELILQAAKEHQFLENNLKNQIEDAKSSRTGRLRIGLSPGRTLHFLPVILPDFRREFPQLQLEIDTRAGTGYETMVAEGDLDIAFVMDSADVPSRIKNALVYEPLFVYYCLLAAPPHHPIARETEGIFDWRERPAIDLNRVRDEPFIGTSHSRRNAQWMDGIYQSYGFVPHETILLSEESAVFNLVQAGIGFALMQDHFAFALKHGAFFRLDKDNSATTLCAIYRKDVFLTRTMRTFINLVKEHTTMGTLNAIH